MGAVRNHFALLYFVKPSQVKLRKVMKKTKRTVAGYTVHGYKLEKFSHLEGKIRTIIEAVGLPEKQSKSLTDLILGQTWGMWENPQFTYYYEVDEEGNDILEA